MAIKSSIYLFEKKKKFHPAQNHKLNNENLMKPEKKNSERPVSRSAGKNFVPLGTSLFIS